MKVEVWKTDTDLFSIFFNRKDRKGKTTKGAKEKLSFEETSWSNNKKVIEYIALRPLRKIFAPFAVKIFVFASIL